MRRLSPLLLLASASLASGIAVGQTGLIVQPWRASPAAAPALVPQPLPASGLSKVTAPPAGSPQPPAVVTVSAAHKWSPPVVPLLVDPWATTAVTAPATRPRWEPRAIEIVDPWAGAEPAARVARHPTTPPPTSIF